MPLTNPTQARSEGDEYGKRDADDEERARRVMDDHLVDYDLREDRGRERHRLDRERGEQDVAPDPPVLEDLGHEPAESEAAILGDRCLLAPEFRRGWHAMDHLACTALCEISNGTHRRGFRPGLEAGDLLRVGRDDDSKRAICLIVPACRIAAVTRIAGTNRHGLQHRKERRRNLREPRCTHLVHAALKP